MIVSNSTIPLASAPLFDDLTAAILPAKVKIEGEGALAATALGNTSALSSQGFLSVLSPLGTPENTFAGEEAFADFVSEFVPNSTGLIHDLQAAITLSSIDQQDTNLSLPINTHAFAQSLALAHVGIEENASPLVDLLS